MKKQIAFIVNPISGGKNKSNFTELVAKHLNHDTFNYQIFHTRSTEHNQELAKNAAQNFDVVVAVGGDGTINNTAKYLAGTNKLFGIIPMGSGNGLAKHHKLPANITKAFKAINQLNHTRIDTGMANEHFFLNIAGVGFDAHVSWEFDHASQRGFYQYAKITLNEFSQYQAFDYQLEIDGKAIKEKAFIICVANGSQYGNNAFIAPLAQTTDGEFDITIVKPITFWHLPWLGWRIFTKTLLSSNKAMHYKGKQVTITRTKKGVVNIDGEPIMMAEKIDIKMLPSNLSLITP